MKIIYIYSNCSKRKYEDLFHHSPVMISQQAQKYHSLLIDGLKDNKAKVRCISGLPINRRVTKKLFILPQTEIINGIRYFYSGFINVPILRQFCLFCSSFLQSYRYSKQEGDYIFICDILSISCTYGGILASKLRGVKSLGIVTDVPGMIGNHKRNKLLEKINWYLFSWFDSYVFLTEEMNRLINIYHKPYLVLEGHVDKNMSRIHNSLQEKYPCTVVMYAGLIHKIYGVPMLIQAFIKAGMENCELHIYGEGDFAEELKEICRENPQIRYFGMKPNEYIVQQEMKASLLVNPRPTNEEYTKYSFPSKNMEYMVSGTPVLTTKLSGMPKEYEDYVYLIEDESVEGLSKTLKEVLSKTKEELHRMGQQAKHFVLNHKNNTIQAKKILYLVSQIRGKKK